MRFKPWLLGLGIFLLPLMAHAEDVDTRFQIHLQQEVGMAALDVADAMTLALPILWKRVVPTADLDKANTLKGRRSLVLQFKPVKHGLYLVFNPVQVKAYLRGYGITMIPVRPNWNLSVFVLGFSGVDRNISLDLMNYSYGIADELGFELGPRGKKLQLIFAPAIDNYGQTLIHVDVQGAFSADVLSATNQEVDGYLSYQLQAWLDAILREIRDAYSLGTLQFKEESSEVLITMELEASLASQVMLEQALLREPEVIAIVPVFLQKARRQYRLLLRDGDDAWLASWFADYGLTATKQMDDNFVQWFIQ